MRPRYNKDKTRPRLVENKNSGFFFQNRNKFMTLLCLRQVTFKVTFIYFFPNVSFVVIQQRLSFFTNRKLKHITEDRFFEFALLFNRRIHLKSFLRYIYLHVFNIVFISCEVTVSMQYRITKTVFPLCFKCLGVHNVHENGCIYIQKSYNYQIECINFAICTIWVSIVTLTYQIQS